MASKLAVLEEITLAVMKSWNPQIHAMLQTKLAPILNAQFGVGYTELYSKGVYRTQTLMADLRFQLSPIRMESAFPYFYAGFGVTKDQQTSGTKFLPMIPAGVGIQTPMADNLLIQVSAGYNLSLSDKLDGRVRVDNNLNSLTNQKQDAFYTFGVALIFGARKNDKDRTPKAPVEG